ncbi:MAG TPA: 50S ribosomal protein L30 [Candidatus Nitrosotenuis sp.]|nr:50S ribosomal protein L30 [Candidatus Nitrosotenuis sp.]
MAKAYLVVRMRGQINVPHWAKNTLNLLKLEKKFRATIIPAKDNTNGMLDAVKHYVSWQEANLDITKELLNKKGRKSGYKKITDEDITKLGFKTIDDLATSISEGKVSMNKIKPIKPWFALSPPKRGFKRSTRKTYGEGGVLGQNKELAELVRSMM